jgi:hypothetical protein
MALRDFLLVVTLAATGAPRFWAGGSALGRAGR